MIEPSSTWSSDLRLNLAMLSYSTGLSIPRVASPWFFRSKIGIMLLIPVQLLLMFVITIPCLFMELALGQYSNKAVIKIWDLCPLLRGIGIGSFLTFLLYQTYYTFLCTCTLCFTFLSFSSEPQWKSCNKSWNKVNCFTLHDNYSRRLDCHQKYSKDKCDKMQWQSSIEQFYFNRILNVDDTSGYVGTPQPELLVYALFTAAIVFFANWGGPRSTEKFLMALAIIPTLQLIMLFFTPFTEYNGFITLNYLFSHFDKTRLGDLKFWTTAINLSLSSPGLGFGVYITLGTHSSFRSPLHLKVIVISLVSALFTILYCITLQIFLISLCLQSNMLVEDFFSLEQELAMPEAVFFLERSPRFWMTMWLSNSYMLGLRSLIVMMSVNAEIVYNSAPRARKYHNSWIFLFCLMIYSGGIFFSTRIGYLVVKTIDKIINEFVLLFLNISNLIGIVYFYGVRTFRDDIHFMLGITTSKYWNALYALNPIFLGLILVYNIHDFYTTNATVPFSWIYTIENVLIWYSLMLVLLYASFHLIRAHILNENVRVFEPTEDWGPRHQNLSKSREMFKKYNMAKEYMYRQERFRQEFGEIVS